MAHGDVWLDSSTATPPGDRAALRDAHTMLGCLPPRSGRPHAIGPCTSHPPGSRSPCVSAAAGAGWPTAPKPRSWSSPPQPTRTRCSRPRGWCRCWGERLLRGSALVRLVLRACPPCVLLSARHALRCRGWGVGSRCGKHACGERGCGCARPGCPGTVPARATNTGPAESMSGSTRGTCNI